MRTVGIYPEVFSTISFPAEVFDLERKALADLATRKQVTVNFTGKKDGPKMDILIYLPNAAKTPVPTFVILNFGGNHTIPTRLSSFRKVECARDAM